MNLYSRLYKYKPEKKSQMENFCTEALCDILNRLTHEQMMFLFEGICLPNIENSQNLDWKTQYRIELPKNNGSAIPDLVGMVDGIVKYIIEVKIDAAFTTKVNQDETEKDSFFNGQLQNYGQWLKENNNDDNSYLILLTDKTLPDKGFFDVKDKSYGVKRENRLLIYWQNIYDVFKGLNDTSHFLMSEFNEFLTEKGLAMELPKRSDFAVLELMMNGSGKRLEFLMTTLNSKIKQRYGKCELLNFASEDKYKKDGWAFLWERGLNRSFVNFKNIPFFFDWGFYFPEHDCENEEKTDSPCFYIELSCDDETHSSLIKVIKLLDKKSSLIGASIDEFVFDKNGVLVEGGIISGSTISIDDLLTDEYDFDTLFNFVTEFMDKIMDALKTLE